MHSFSLKRLTSFLILTQLVWTQTSFADLEHVLHSRFSKMNRTQAVKIAYDLYQFDVKLRNRLFRKAETEIQANLTDIQNGVIRINRNPDEEEQELTGAWTAIENLGEIKKAQIPHESVDTRGITREKLLEGSDKILVALGSSVQKDGSLSQAPIKIFGQKWNARGGASNSKLIFSLSALNVGVGVVVLPFVVLAVSSWGSSQSALWWVRAVTQ